MRPYYRLFAFIILLFVWNISVPETIYNISEAEHIQMQNEADDWIDDMPEGYQDKMSDAILHSIRGFYTEIRYFRNQTKDTTTQGLKIQEFMGGKNHDIRMRLYEMPIGIEKNLPRPLLVYFHGGVWSLGSIESADDFCRKLASSGKINVLSVDYPLAPENPYPGALNKCIEAITYAYEKSNEWGSSHNLLNVGGDGAGGNLALSAVNKIIETCSDDIKINSLVVYYPILNAIIEKTNFVKNFSKGYGLDSRLLEAGITAYLADAKENISLYEPMLSPINLELENLKKLPPILMIAAGQDMLIDCETEYISKLKSVGKKPVFVNFTGAIHGFISDGHQSTALDKAVAITEGFLLEHK